MKIFVHFSRLNDNLFAFWVSDVSKCIHELILKRLHQVSNGNLDHDESSPSGRCFSEKELKFKEDSTSKFFICNDCDGGLGAFNSITICEECVKDCHLGHRVVPKKNVYGDSFCDCPFMCSCKIISKCTNELFLFYNLEPGLNYCQLMCHYCIRNKHPGEKPLDVNNKRRCHCGVCLKSATDPKLVVANSISGKRIENTKYEEVSGEANDPNQLEMVSEPTVPKK